MSHGYGMYLQQTTKMHMTHQLRQALHILQYSTPELLASIEQELRENPMLEAEGIDWDAIAVQQRQHTAPSGKIKGGLQGSDDYDPLYRAAWNDTTLEKHLKDQLHFLKAVSQTVQSIIVYMIGNLDPNGYLMSTPDEIAAALRVQREEVDQALRILQSLEPFGVGAMSLKECLLIQIYHLPEYPALAPVLISDHLEDVAHHRIHKLATLFKTPPQVILQAIDVIKKLNPRPGAAFGQDDIKYITPDVVIERVGESFVVTVQDSAAPRLSINGQYEQMWRENRAYEDAKQFLTQKRSSAIFFIKCIEQRRTTLSRVAQAIVEEQIEFFRKGASYLKPMALKQIAGKMGVHESTISRAAAGKYAQTPWGIFELKYFFPAGLQGDHPDDSASSVKVKARMKELIGREQSGSPLSDQKLASVLADEGIHISRRTVAKYREELGIHSSAKRKRT